MLQVKIYSRMDDGTWLWGGDGRIDNDAITDCAADLGDDVYDALDNEIQGVGSYTVEVEGREYRADVEDDGCVHCQCGEWTGERCNWTGPIGETVIVEYMPHQYRDSHTTARNHGVYPHNGAVRVRVEKSCADLLLKDKSEQEWSRIDGE